MDDVNLGSSHASTTEVPAEMRIAVCLFLLSCLLTGAQCLPGGAPNGACDGVAPSRAAQGGHGADPQTSAVPYVLTGLPANNMNYTPGMTYSLTLSGMTNETFRGFLVVSTNSSVNRVGDFASGGDDSKLTCTDMRGITHTNRTDKVNVNFTWTAPDEGTGTVEVRFAVVRMQTDYWADQLAVTLFDPTMPPTEAPSSAYTSHVTIATILLAVIGLALMVVF